MTRAAKRAVASESREFDRPFDVILARLNLSAPRQIMAFQRRAVRFNCAFHFVKHLLLWDIDGTLISSGGAGMRALQVALRSVFGIDGSLADIDFAGRTDRWIMRQVFAKFRLAATPENFSRFSEGYLAALPAEMANPRACVLPGVREILRAVANHGAIAQGLLTGNMQRGAQVKLTHHGLWDYFEFGAFAEDSEQRNDLGPHAVRRALERHGVNFAADDVWIIGDTPHDIACGKAIGARTLAVGTGSSTVAQLQTHAPTAAIENLANTRAVLELLLAPPKSNL